MKKKKEEEAISWDSHNWKWVGIPRLQTFFSETTSRTKLKERAESKDFEIRFHPRPKVKSRFFSIWKCKELRVKCLTFKNPYVYICKLETSHIQLVCKWWRQGRLLLGILEFTPPCSFLTIPQWWSVSINYFCYINSKARYTVEQLDLRACF